jgi:hypothetical protein
MRMVRLETKKFLKYKLQKSKLKIMFTVAISHAYPFSLQVEKAVFKLNYMHLMIQNRKNVLPNAFDPVSEVKSGISWP